MVRRGKDRELSRAQSMTAASWRLTHHSVLTAKLLPGFVQRLFQIYMLIYCLSICHLSSLYYLSTCSLPSIFYPMSVYIIHTWLSPLIYHLSSMYWLLYIYQLINCHISYIDLFSTLHLHIVYNLSSIISPSLSSINYHSPILYISMNYHFYVNHLSNYFSVMDLSSFDLSISTYWSFFL